MIFTISGTKVGDCDKANGRDPPKYYSNQCYCTHIVKQSLQKFPTAWTTLPIEKMVKRHLLLAGSMGFNGVSLEGLVHFGL